MEGWKQKNTHLRNLVPNLSVTVHDREKQRGGRRVFRHHQRILVAFARVVRCESFLGVAGVAAKTSQNKEELGEVYTRFARVSRWTVDHASPREDDGVLFPNNKLPMSKDVGGGHKSCI